MPSLGVFGIKGFWYNLRDSAGYFNEAAGAGDADGTGMTRARGAKSIATQVPDADRLTQGGDNETLFSKLVESDSLPGGTYTSAVHDPAFDATCQGVTNETLAGATVGFVGTAPDTLADLVVIIHMETTDLATGATKWLSLLCPKSQVKPNFGTGNTKQYMDFNYSITFDKVTQMPWGASAAKAVPLRPISDDNPVLEHAFTGNNTVVAFTLPYSPTGTSPFDATVWVDGVLQVYTTDYTIAGAVITFGVAPAANTKIQVLYQVASTDLYS